MNDKPLQGMKGVTNTGKNVRIKGFSDQPSLNAIVRTLQPDPEVAPATTAGGERKIDEGIMQKVFQRARLTGSAVNDYKVIVETQPDIKRVESLLVDGVLSPNDATPSPLQYSINSPGFPSKELISKATEIVRDYFRFEHKIDGKLRKYLQKIMFSQGSVPLFVAPQAAIDEMINPGDTRISLENVKDYVEDDLSIRSRGVIGRGIEFKSAGDAGAVKTADENTTRAALLRQRGIGLEDLRDFVRGDTSRDASKVLGYSVTDNPGILSFYRATERLRENIEADAMGSLYMGHLAPSTESDDVSGTVVDELKKEFADSGRTLTDNAVYRRAFKTRTYGFDAVKSVKPMTSLNRETVGHPVWFELSAECCVPVHTPGAPEDHIGYLVALDSSGAPLILTDTLAGYDGLVQRQQLASSGMSNILQTTYSSMSSETDTSLNAAADSTTPADMARMYSEIVEKDLLERLKNGVRGGNVVISRPENLYKLMLMRALRKQHTRVLYVPASMMSYMAIDYDNNGIGKSLLHDVRIIAALRTVLNFAQVNGEIKNSIAGVKLRIQLDPEDPDPEVTVEEIMHHYIQMRQSSYIYGARPADIQHQLAMASVDVEVEGHDGYAQTKVETEDTRRNVNTPDRELEERLKTMIYQGIGGIPPELVNRAEEIDFAATYIGSNAQLTKLVMNIQPLFEEGLARFMRNFTLMSSILMSKLVEVVKDHKDALGEGYSDHSEVDVVIELLDRLEVSLPRPKTSTSQAQLESLEEYERLVDKQLEYFLSRDVLTDTEYGEKISSLGDDLMMSMKAKIMRDFIRENNINPEVIAMFDYQDDDDLDALVSQFEEYRKRLSGLLRPYIKLSEKQGRINDRELAAVEEGDGGGGFDSGGDDFGGGDEFGMDDDFGDLDADLGGGADEEEPAEEEPIDFGNVDEEA